jgi:hypothetical protein
MRPVATSIRKSALAELASWFHQDFALMGVSPDQWGREFIKPLSGAKKRVLRDELHGFLAAYPGKSAKGVCNAWVRLGAAGWPRATDLRSTINSWIKALE